MSTDGFLRCKVRQGWTGLTGGRHDDCYMELLRVIVVLLVVNGGNSEGSVTGVSWPSPTVARVQGLCSGHLCWSLAVHHMPQGTHDDRDHTGMGSLRSNSIWDDTEREFNFYIVYV